jgi:hypothetical protein
MSTTKPKENDIEELWLEDSERKIREMDNGKDQAIPAKEGFTDFGQKSGKKKST